MACAFGAPLTGAALPRTTLLPISYYLLAIYGGTVHSSAPSCSDSIAP